MRKICVVTGTRAEYGILSGVMRRLKESDEATLQIIATNMHLSPRFGMTVNEIIADGFVVDERIPLPLEDDSAAGTVRAMGVAMSGFAEAFNRLSPDFVVILGDRYEMLAAASAAAVFGIPVVHLHGGEITEGAYDDAIRHAITKLSTYHFTSTEEYRQRVIQMGEEPERVFNSGSPAVDAIRRFTPLTRAGLASSLGVSLAEKFIVVTYHPVTMQPGEEVAQTRSLLEALEDVMNVGSADKGVRIIFTLPNSDAGGRSVAEAIGEWCDRNADMAVAVTSLGRIRYYSALTYAAAVVGNSSSGLIEAPSFGIPTLNIGDRQKGRARGNTVVESGTNRREIADGLRKVMSDEVRAYCRESGKNPYFKDGAEKFIYDTVMTLPVKKCCPKHFHDISRDIGTDVSETV
ncbi:MAG: UDP-N-acetylglucosamine 2-epimerase (hydrolyzing) [Muribaculaceae bacterium]|nr:UDP-N-acetylglucosamine 2-epimerase (hydrolyzing) [Muribaculaceae bacterium]